MRTHATPVDDRRVGCAVGRESALASSLVFWAGGPPMQPPQSHLNASSDAMLLYPASFSSPALIMSHGDYGLQTTSTKY